MTILRSDLLQAQPWDVAGIGASLLCVAHCLATPALMVFLPVLEALEKPTHAGLALALLAIGLLAFWPGYLRHKRWSIVAAGSAGFVLIALGVVAPEGLMNETTELMSTLLGGSILIAAHLRNAYFCRHCQECGPRGCLNG